MIVVLSVCVTPPGKCFAQCHFLVGLSMGSYPYQMTQVGCYVSFDSSSPWLWPFLFCVFLFVVHGFDVVVCALVLW